MVAIGKAGLPRADLTLPRSPVHRHHAAVVGNIGHGGNRRCQATAGPQRESAPEATAGQATAAMGIGRASYVGNGRDRNRESRRYRRNRNGQGVCPARANRNGLP
jgi:hypothetical protein